MELPYEKGSVDEILVYHVIEHIELSDLQSLLHYWQTLLKPGGVLVIEAPDSEKLLPFILHKINAKQKDWDWGTFAIYANKKLGHRCAVTAEYAQKLLGSGWAIIEAEPTRDTGFQAFRLECTKIQ